MEVRLGEVIELNPRETIVKNTIARKISMNDLEPFTRDISTFSYERYSGGTKFRNNDVLLARITPCLENGKTAFVNILDQDEVAFGSTEYFVLRGKKDLIDPYYLYYLSISQDFRNVVIRSMTGTSGRQRAQKDSILNYKLNLPNIQYQRAIAAKLKVLDDKIRLNKQINDNLVKLLDSTYSYFLDSNPLESGKIDDIGSVIGGGTPSKKVKEYWNGTIPWITPKDLSISGNFFTSKGSTNISDLGYQNSSTKMLSAGSVLYSSRAPIGYISIANNPVTTNQGFKSIVPDKGYPTEFIFELLRNETNKIINSATGSTFKEVSGSQLKNHQIRIPDKSECNKFSNLVRPIFRNIKDLEYENQSLVKLRGLLLSKYF